MGKKTFRIAEINRKILKLPGTFNFIYHFACTFKIRKKNKMFSGGGVLTCVIGFWLTCVGLLGIWVLFSHSLPPSPFFKQFFNLFWICFWLIFWTYIYTVSISFPFSHSRHSLGQMILRLWQWYQSVNLLWSSSCTIIKVVLLVYMVLC